MPRRLGTVLGLSASAAALAALVLAATVPASGAAVPASSVATSTAALSGGPGSTVAFVDPKKGKTKTPIKHLVVIFDENISYDHYFGTYPKATNNGGTKFKALPGHAQERQPGHIASSSTPTPTSTSRSGSAPTRR